MRIGDTVVLDGDLSLLIPVDGESGIVTKVIGQDLPTYTGVTEVDPDFDGVTLQTANKVLVNNITVNPIKVESVSNLSGGRTVYIGGII
jgi:hypothetical protein